MNRTDWPATVFAAALLVTAGCAIHHFDPATGTEHLWGIGHMKVKITPTNEGLQAVVRGVETIGLSFGRDDERSYVAFGWHNRQRVDILDDNTSVRLEWCGSDFVNVRVGSELPAALRSTEPTASHVGENKEASE